MSLSSTLRRAVRPFVALCAFGLFATGCESPSGSEDGTYALVSINAQPLPASRSFAFVETTSGSLELDDDGTAELTFKIRCNNVPQGATCEIYDDGTERYTGEYSRSEGWVRFGNTEFQATFASEGVVLRLQCTPGYVGCPLTLNFER